jgi:hypothetical protein
MIKFSSIFGIVAGALSIFAAMFTILFGGVASMVGADSSRLVTNLGVGGIFFSILAIVFSAMLPNKPKGAGWLLIATSVLGAVLGGTLVAVFMVMTLICGVLSVIASRGLPKISESIAHLAQEPVAGVNGDTPRGLKASSLVVGVALVIVLVIALMAVAGKSSSTTSSTGSNKTAIELLVEAPASDIKPTGVLADNVKS